MSSKKPSEAEVEILQILWEEQPCSVRHVHEIIGISKDVGYTTILKQLQRMQDKSLVTREPGDGKSFLYSAAQPQGQTQSNLLGRLLKTAFRGDVNELVMHALGDAKASGEDLEAIKDFIAQIEASGDR
ncbi:BlaI/MecI/CopY family transcriptional regulator [bacterium AH-315-J19]|nr:BlaI/MecI/CopY family transcriptional regulator [Robiginitomaculum sp.]MBN4058551.1 BlaI/MecI/CopY family transcriptional regulator [bacterium AH-315-J19]